MKTAFEIANERKWPDGEFPPVPLKPILECEDCGVSGARFLPIGNFCFGCVPTEEWKLILPRVMDIEKPTAADVLPLVREYYEAHPVGGSLHIVLDDGNIKDGDVSFCLEQAIAEKDKAGEQLARIILKMSKKARYRLYSEH